MMPVRSGLGAPFMYTLKQLRQIDKALHEDFREVRERVQRAIENCPKTVTLADALKQQEKFNVRVVK